MDAVSFNYHVHRVAYDDNSLKLVYDYSIKIMRKFLEGQFGNNQLFLTLPHDVFTKRIYEKPPKFYIRSPSAWLCKLVKNQFLSFLNLKDNQTVEFEDVYPTSPDYEKELEITSPELKKAFDKLDRNTKLILYLEVKYSYQLNEIAAILDKKPTYVRTKKCRAIKLFKKILDIEENN